MVKVPTPDEEDRRHLCRERKALTAERCDTSIVSKDFYSARAYPDISRCAATGASGWKNSKPATAAPSLSILTDIRQIPGGFRGQDRASDRLGQGDRLSRKQEVIEGGG